MERTVDGQTATFTTKAMQGTDDRHVVETPNRIDGANALSEEFTVIANDDVTCKLIHQNLGTRDTFTDVSQGAAGDGSASSSPGNAGIPFHDDEYGTPRTLYLHDGYSGCLDANRAMLQAGVRPDTVDATWGANPRHSHRCIVPPWSKDGNIRYGTEAVSLDGFDDDDGYGSHAFVNCDASTALYGVSLTFDYGMW